MTRHDIEVAIGCLDRAVHAGTSDAETLAAIGAWRRKTGKRLIGEVCEGYFRQLPRRADSEDDVRDRRLAAENLWLKEEIASWRREAEKWHEEYERIFGVLTRAETKRLYDKVAQRHGAAAIQATKNGGQIVRRHRFRRARFSSRSPPAWPLSRCSSRRNGSCSTRCRRRDGAPSYCKARQARSMRVQASRSSSFEVA